MRHVGYVEYAYAKQNNLAYTKLVFRRRQAGKPDGRELLNAAKGADWSKPSRRIRPTRKVTMCGQSPPPPLSRPQSAEEKPKQGAGVGVLRLGLQNGALSRRMIWTSLPDNVVEQVRYRPKTSIKTATVGQLY